MTLVMSKQEKVAHLLTETVRVLCQSSFDDWSEMKIQGLLAITLNNKDIFLVQINEAIDSYPSATTTTTTTSQPCSKGVQRATKACVSDNSKDSTDCNNGVVESSCRQSLRSASKSVEKVSNYETTKKNSAKLKLSKLSAICTQESEMCDFSHSVLNTTSKKKVLQLGNKKKSKRSRRWRKSTNKYSVANSYRQHQDGHSKCAKHLAMVRKPLCRRNCTILRTRRAEKSNSIAQMEMCGSDDDFSDNFDRKQARTNCMFL